MQSGDESLILMLVSTTTVVLMLAIFIFLFVLVYQRRMIKQHMEIQRIQIDKQRELLKAVIDTQEQERRRLSEEIHDGLGQVLSSVKLNLHHIEKRLSHPELNLEKVNQLLVLSRQLIDESINEARNISRNLLPSILTKFGLEVALNELINRTFSEEEIKVNFQFSSSCGRLKRNLELSIYRICQELFNNSFKHSGASIIDLHIFLSENNVELIFSDNGRGFDVNRIFKESEGSGLGLRNIQSRVDMLNGKLSIESSENSGVSYLISLNTKTEE